MPAPLDGLLAIRVSVRVADPDGGTPLATYQLTRWMIDPALGLEQLEAEEEAMQEEMAARERQHETASQAKTILTCACRLHAAGDFSDRFDVGRVDGFGRRGDPVLRS